MRPMMMVFQRTVVGLGIASNSWRASCGFPSWQILLRRERMEGGVKVEEWFGGGEWNESGGGGGRGRGRDEPAAICERDDRRMQMNEETLVTLFSLCLSSFFSDKSLFCQLLVLLSIIYYIDVDIKTS